MLQLDGHCMEGHMHHCQILITCIFGSANWQVWCLAAVLGNTYAFDGKLAPVANCRHLLEMVTSQTPRGASVVLGCCVLTKATEVHQSEGMTWRKSG